MTLKVKAILVYLSALLLSHVWQSVASDDGEVILSPSNGSASAHWLLFDRAGRPDPNLRALFSHLVERNVSVRYARGDEWFGEQGAFENLDERGGNLTVVGSGYGSIGATLFSRAHNHDRAISLVLLSPKLTTRFELLGDERLNRAMKAFQIAWFWVLEKGVPHFGLSKKLPYGLESSKMVFSVNQEEASEAYSNLHVPLLIAYPEGAAFKSSGALEAYMGVNTSVEFLSMESESEFLEGVWAFSKLEPERIAKTSTVKRFEDFPGISLGDTWAAFLLGVSTLASEDLACIGGGLLAGAEAVSLEAALLGCMLGIFLGDLGIFAIGRIFGSTAVDLPIIRKLVSPKLLNKGSDWFQRRGMTLVILTRFFPGSRVPTYFAAGVVKTGWIQFSFALFVASAIWTPVLVLLAFYFGEAFLNFFESLGAAGWLGILAFVVCFSLAIRVCAQLASWRNRRLLYSRWRRISSWEFWPMWAVYFPVVIYIIWLAVKYRSLSLPFSVNPCMPASGLVYESKIQILKLLEESGVPIARFKAIELELPLEKKLERFDSFMLKLKLSYPVVLKPDIGQRGQGVVIARNRETAVSFFEEQCEDTIVQEFIEGCEYGIFYQRFASEPEGSVTSITDKRCTSVVGDGKSTLETLILKDKRTVLMAAYFLSEYEDQLEMVPSVGERVMLASIGTHSRGALFLDGQELMTKELVAAIDSFSRIVPGFHFGRYDLRVPSPEHLKTGQKIRVIELNGITSEPTNMYDPKHGPIFGWRSLIRQWRSIFAIAKENRLAGHEPVSKKYLLRLASAHFRGVPSRDLS